jgi:hypothetical protein
MRSANPTIGSPTDVIHSVVIRLKGLGSLKEAEWAYPRLASQLEGVIRRVDAVRHRRGSVQGLDAAVAWLRQAILESPALEGPDGEPLRSELLAIAARIRD